jgi:hypothetical protein
VGGGRYVQDSTGWTHWLRFCVISGHISSSTPFFLSDDLGAPVRAQVFVAFLRYCHLDIPVLAGVAASYGIDVDSRHKQQGFAALATLPLARFTLRRLHAAGRLRPFARWAFSARAVFLCPFLPGFAPEVAACAVVIFFLAARPAEVASGEAARSLDWVRIRWLDARGRPCDPCSPALDHVVVHLYRKCHIFSGHFLPLFRTGERICPVTLLQRLWQRQGRPTRGRVFARVAPARLTALLARLAAVLQLPKSVFTPYALRRGWQNALEAAGAPPALVADFAGHAPPVTVGAVSATHKRYIDASAEALRPFWVPAVRVAFRPMGMRAVAAAGLGAGV